MAVVKCITAPSVARNITVQKEYEVIGFVDENELQVESFYQAKKVKILNDKNLEYSYVITNFELVKTEEDIFQECMSNIYMLARGSYRINNITRSSMLKSNNMSISCGTGQCSGLNVDAREIKYVVSNQFRGIDSNILERLIKETFKMVVKDFIKRNHHRYGVLIFSTNFYFEEIIMDPMDEIADCGITTMNPNEEHNIRTWLVNCNN